MGAFIHQKASIPNKSLLLLVGVVIAMRFYSLGFQGPYSFPNGSDWSQYLMASEFIWRYAPDLNYPPWREPLYPYLLGLFSFGDYLRSAMILSTTGWMLTFVGLWLFSIQYGYGIALTSVFVLTLFPLFSESLHYMNPYPLIAGCCAMNLGGSFQFQKNRNGFWFVCAILFGLLAILLEMRCCISVLFSLIWLLKGYRTVSKKAWLVAFTTSVIMGGFHILLKMQFHLPKISLIEKAERQREFLFRDSMAEQLFPGHTNAEWVASLCIGTSSKVMELTSWFSDCSLAMFQVNMEAFIANGLLPPIWLMIILLVVMKNLQGWLLPTIVLIYLSLSLLVWQPSRYLFFVIFPLFAFLIVGCVEIGGLFGRWKDIASVGIVLGVSFFWPGWGIQEGFLSRDYPEEWPRIIPDILQQAQGEIPLDCSKQDLLLATLSIYRQTDWPFLPSDEYCAQQFISKDHSHILSSVQITNSGWKPIDEWNLKKGTVYLYARFQ